MPENENNCPSMESLKSFSVGDLPGKQIEQIDMHLGDCVSCQEKLASLDGSTDLLTTELQRIGGEGSSFELSTASATKATHPFLPPRTINWAASSLRGAGQQQACGSDEIPQSR